VILEGLFFYENADIQSSIYGCVILLSLQMGYRLFDTAKIYGSEPAVGKALREAILDRTVERGDIFVTSKLWGSDHHDPVSGLKQTLG
jgi:alcohol dehydrogenase (NADP+)